MEITSKTLVTGLVWILLATAVLAGEPASILEWEHNGPGLARLVEPVSVDLASLQSRYREIRRVTGTAGFVAEVDARRLINRNDWFRALEKMPSGPWNYYGSETLASWRKAMQKTLLLRRGELPSMELMREIHRVACKGHYFRGYEFRRIQKALADGTISPARSRELLSRMERGESVFFSGVDHAGLLGVFRSEALEDFVHTGETIGADGRRYFIGDELARIRANPNLALDEATVVPLGQGRYEATARYVPAREVESRVRDSLDRARRVLEASPSLDEIVRTLVTLGRDLMTIHPFIDGNGRTIRLLVDRTLDRFGLPPPLFPNELDMLMSPEEDQAYMVRAMVAYLDAMEDALEKRPDDPGQGPWMTRVPAPEADRLTATP